MSSGAKPTPQKPNPRSKISALRDPITGQILMMPAGDLKAYQAVCAAFHAQFDPQGIMELQAVQRLADTQWRLSQLPGRESAVYALANYEGHLKVDSGDPEVNTTLAYATVLRDNPDPITFLSIHEQRLTHLVATNLRLVREIQSQRRRRPANIDSSGFVCSSREFEDENAQRAREGAEPSINPILKPRP